MSRADRQLALRALAAIRLAVLPVAYSAQALVGHPELEVPLFDALFGLVVVYALVAAWRAFRGRSDALWVYGVLDLAAIAALAYASGGAGSELRRTFFVIPIAAAFLTKPRLAALWAAGSLGIYLAIALPRPPVGAQASAESVVIFSLYLFWIGISATVLSAVLTRRARRIRQLLDDMAELAASRGRHVAAALDAEDRERRRLADALHDSAIQTLLVARQDLTEAEHGEDQALTRAQQAVDQVICQLREQVFDLHPQILEYAGLKAALEALAEHEGRRGRFTATVDVGPDAPGVDDQLVMALARELLINIAKHARARKARVSLSRRDDCLELEVSDDGIGFTEDRRRSALRQGHIGLASATERVAALGGDIHIHSSPGQGTEILVRFPIGRERRRVARTGTGEAELAELTSGDAGHYTEHQAA